MLSNAKHWIHLYVRNGCESETPKLNQIDRSCVEPHCHRMVKIQSRFRMFSHCFPKVASKLRGLKCKGLGQRVPGFWCHLFVLAFTEMSTVPPHLMLRLKRSPLSSLLFSSVRPLWNQSLLGSLPALLLFPPHTKVSGTLGAANYLCLLLSLSLRQR